MVPEMLAPCSLYRFSSVGWPAYDQTVTDFQDLTAAVRAFTDERDWHQFHSPKNLAMAIAGEAGELAAELQWVDGEASTELVRTDDELRERVAMEMADVLIYLARMADVCGIDPVDAAHRKLAINQGRFPSKGEEG